MGDAEITGPTMQVGGARMLSLEAFAKPLRNPATHQQKNPCRNHPRGCFNSRYIHSVCPRWLRATK